MKHLALILICAAVHLRASAQQYIHFHTSNGTETFELFEDDSLYYDATHSTQYFSNGGNLNELLVANLDSITFSDAVDQTVHIHFNGAEAFVDNPLTNGGIDVEVTGAHVVIHSQFDNGEVNYICSGTANDGSVKVYSENKFSLLLNDVNLTNPTGPAVNIQSKKRAFIHLVAGTENSLTDGTQYSAPAMVDGIEEDQKAALFSEGKMTFIGAGMLTVNGLGNDQHAICADRELTVKEGHIIVTSGTRDGVHANGFVMQGGVLNITATRDGVDADEDQIEVHCGSISVQGASDNVVGMRCDSTFVMTGGSVTLEMTGNQAKGIQSQQAFHLLGGTLDGTVSGDAVLEPSGSGFDVKYPSFIKCHQNMAIAGGVIEASLTGAASRGISCNGDLSMTGGEVMLSCSGDGSAYNNEEGEDDAYYGAGLKVVGNVTQSGGSLNIQCSGDGARGMVTDGDWTFGGDMSSPELAVTTAGESITITAGGGGGGGGPGGGGPGGGGPGGGNNGDYCEAKAVKAKGSVHFISGSATISSADDAIKASVSLTVNGGSIDILNSVEGLEAPTIEINGGTILLAATDDGINATQGEEVFNNDGSELNVNGGTITVNMSGSDVDCMDSNGDITILGGLVNLNYPAQGPSSALDSNGTTTIGPNAEVYGNGVPL